MGARRVSTLTIVDTDILIDAARQVREAVDCLDQIERISALAISVVTEMELLIGCQNKTEQRNTERFLQRFQVLRLAENACDQAVELLRQYRLSHGTVDSRCHDCCHRDDIGTPVDFQESARLSLHRRTSTAAVSFLGYHVITPPRSRRHAHRRADLQAGRQHCPRRRADDRRRSHRGGRAGRRGRYARLGERAHPRFSLSRASRLPLRMHLRSRSKT